jgi:hypothetical protein
MAIRGLCLLDAGMIGEEDDVVGAVGRCTRLGCCQHCTWVAGCRLSSPLGLNTTLGSGTLGG